MVTFFHRIAITTAFVTLLAATLIPVYADNQGPVREDKIEGVIVKFKTEKSEPASRSSRTIMAAPQGANDLPSKVADLLTSLKNKKKNKRVIAAMNQDAIDLGAIEQKNTIDNNTVVLSLGKSVSLENAKSTIDTIAAYPTVAYAVADEYMYPISELSMSASDYISPWGYQNNPGGANLQEAWNVYETKGSDDIVVAVIDTGYVPHADLRANLLPGYDFISDIEMANGGGLGSGSDGKDMGDWVSLEDTKKEQCAEVPVSDSSWHGSHVAGTIGAVRNTRTGMSGVAWKSKLLPVRVLGKCGGPTSDIIIGMRWAAGLDPKRKGVPPNIHPARVMNLSLGLYKQYGNKCSAAFADAIESIRAKGINIVVAAGNNNESVATTQPANCDGVITVAANDINGKLAEFSNFGPEVKISAPGVHIWSTINKGTKEPSKEDAYAPYNGTSMATPHVAGAIAILLAIDPTLKPEAVLKLLQTTAKPFPIHSGCNIAGKCGAGLLDVSAAVRKLTAR